MMRTPIRLPLLCVWFLAGCPAHRSPDVEHTSAPPPVNTVQTSPAAETGSPLLSLLSYVGRIGTLPVTEQQGEVVRLTDTLTVTGLPSDRLRLGLLLVVGDGPVRDDERAKALLSGAAWDDLAYEAVARLALDLIDERRRHARDRLDASTALEEERKQREDLEARLKAVEKIETDMNNREVEGGDASQAEDPLR